MMHTTTNSCNSIISIRTYSAFNDYSNERCPSNYCCCCCSFPINSCKLLVPTNPSYLYGLRQSTLIHWPPSRRLILGSSDRRFARPSIYDVGRCCFSQSCCVKQERLDRIISRSCIESCCVDKKEKSVDVNRIKNNMGRPRSNLRSNALGDAEAMLSLLTEGIVEECVVIREKKRSSFQEGKIGSKQNAVIGKFQDRKPNLDSGHRESEPKNPRLDSCRVPSRKEGRKREEERKDNPKDEDQKLRRESRGTQQVAIGKLKDRKQNVDYGYSEAELKNHRRESYRVPPREEDRKRVEERENHSKGDDRRLRRRESSSSYYSLTDSGDFESDAEVDVKQEQFLGESSVNQKTDLRKSGGILISEKTEKDQEMYRGEKEQVSRISTSNDFRFGGSVQRDWRKKSEKKLTEDFEETKSRNDSVARKAQLSQAQGNRSMIDSSSKKQFNFQEEQSTSDVKSFGQSSTHVVKDNRASIYSKSSSQHESQNSQEDVGTTSTTWRRSSQGKESKIIGQFQEAGCDYCETCGRSMEKKKIESDIQPRINPSETTIDAELTVRGDHLSESSRYRKHDAKSSNSHQSLAEEESRQHDQTHMVTGRASEKRKSQHYQESMSADDSCIQSKWTQQPEAGLHRLVEKSRTTAESQSGSRLQEEGKSSSSLQISAKQENKKHDRTYLATGQVDGRRKSQHYSEIMDTDATYLQSTLRSQQQAETQKKQEERFSLTTEEVKRLRKESSGKITKDTESSEMSQSEIGESRVDSSNLEINSQSASDKQVYNEQTYSKSKLKSIEEIIEKRKWVDETIVQSTFQTDVQGPSTVHFAEEATKTQQFPSISQTGAQPLREEVKTGKLSATLPPYQHIKESTSSMRQDIGSATEVGSDSKTTHAQTGAQPLREEVKTGKLSATLPPYQHIKESTSSVRQDIGSTTEVGSDSTPTHAQVSRLPSYAEGNLDDVSKSDYTPEDTLLSAAHMQESSSRIVGDFVEKMSHEASTYETSVEKKSSKMDLKHQDKNNMLKRSTHLDSEDALVSAARMQESSSLIYGDFDEKMSQEALNSETIIEKKKSKNSTHQGGNYMLKGSTQFDSDKTASQKHVSDNSYEVSSPDLGELKLHKLDSKGSSGDSGTKEPSDQMWDVKDHFVQESSETEPLEDATSESILAARTGKSLWKTVTGALRLRWSSHSENQKSPVKRESSPSGSGSGETWFSENEADQAKGNAMKAEEICLVQEASSNQSLLGSSRSQKKDVVAMSLDGQLRHAALGASPSSSVLQSSSPSGVATVGESVNLNISEQLSQPSALVNLSTPSRHLRRSSAFEVDDEAEKIEAPTSSSDEQRDSTLEVRQMEGSTSALVNLSTPSRHLRRSSAFEVDDEAEKIEAPTSSSDEQRDSTVEVRQMEGSTSAGTEVEMKGRKLQRSKLVLQRYDDWEDAYRLTREQRKVDEIFMREALSEAIKAAESWEVPVGAVLVQNGNIIARGCNLVEELRDSTAHAEMLCIREASNVLRTWRLSDTTLYVTLEPCPMCAGAILQARISTLVWGAPNKLLGADGSWIRLFPAGGEGEEHAEVTDMPAAPVHPFHPNMKVRRGILEDECADIMQQFFQLRRRKAKEKKGETSSEESDHQPSCFPRPHHRPRLLHKMHNVFHPSKKGAD